jgi:hypothetical protein
MTYYKHKAIETIKKGIKMQNTKIETIHSLQVGDILVDEWGYDQTNVDFYVVEELQGTSFVKFAMVEQVELINTINNDYMECKVVPNVDNIVGRTKRRKADEDNYVGTTSFSCATKWNGKPVRKSWTC